MAVLSPTHRTQNRKGRRRRELVFKWMLMFGAFIIACGTTHLVEIVTVGLSIARSRGPIA
jgi:hypothetical protein